MALIMDRPAQVPAHGDSNDFGPYDEPVSSFEEMTAAELDALVAVWANDSSLRTQTSTGQPKSPLTSSQPHSSLSPEDGNVQYTPTSSNLPDWGNDVNLQLDYDAFDTSPFFPTSATDEPDVISPIDSRSSNYSGMSRAPHQFSRGVSSENRSRDTSPDHAARAEAAQWASMAVTMPMADPRFLNAHEPNHTAFNNAAVQSTSSFNENLIADMALAYGSAIPFRPMPADQTWHDVDISQAYQSFVAHPPMGVGWPSFRSTVIQSPGIAPFAPTSTLQYQHAGPSSQPMDTTNVRPAQ